MMRAKVAFVAMIILLTATLVSCGKQGETEVEKAAAEAKAKAEADAKAIEAAAKELEARETALDAYIYGYPLVTMEITRRVLTNVAQPEASAAPMGQFIKLREYPSVDNHAVTAPNADTLYTIVWLDVSKEPGSSASPT